MTMLKNIETHIHHLSAQFDHISPERKVLLTELAGYICGKIKKEESVKLNFICTHNSRRSQMAQIWAQTAAEYYSIKNIECYSGGTEATEFNPRAVTAVKQYGFEVINDSEGPNPVYQVKFSEDTPPVMCFSKIYSDPSNPQKSFAAIMTCSDADDNCPVVIGAERRFPVRFEDPKKYDGSEKEPEKYMERFEQIGREMLFVMSTAKKLI